MDLGLIIYFQSSGYHTPQEFTLAFGLLTLIYLAITIVGLPGQVGGWVGTKKHPYLLARQSNPKPQSHPAGSLIHDTTPTLQIPKTPPQRPVIAAGIRGLIVAGGKYTGPAMNPMIAFGWAVHTGAYKVRRIRTEEICLVLSESIGMRIRSRQKEVGGGEEL